jgi:hypothetical protein
MTNQFVFANNQSTTLGSNLTSGGTTLTVDTGTGAGFPNPSAGQQFAITLWKIANPSTLEIVYCTARTGDTLTIVRGQEGTSARAWLVGDGVDNRLTAGQMAACLQNFTPPPARTLLTSATTFYVNSTSGNDANNGLTTGTAWQTIAHAVNVLNTQYDNGGHPVTIQLADGNYTESVNNGGDWPGGGITTIQGNLGNNQSVVWTTSSGYCLNQVNGGLTVVQSLKLTSTGSGCLHTSNGGVIQFQNLWFGSSTVDHLHTNDGYILAVGGYAIGGGGQTHAQAFGGTINLAGETLNLQGVPNFSVCFFVVDAISKIFVQGTSYTNTASGVGWSVTRNSYLDTANNGADIIAAGLTTGTTSTGGQLS